MHNFVPAHSIGADLIKVLGLPAMTRSFTLRVAAGEIVTVSCEYYPEDGGIVPALARFDLVRRDEPRPPAPFDFDAWMATRTEHAHRQFIERTSQHLPHERTPEQIARYVLGDSLGGID